MAYKRFVAPGVGRAVRRPTFNIAGIMSPFGLYPVAVAPLLAGETHMFSQTRGRFISQPIKHPIAGGWLEFWTFSVPMRLLSGGIDAVNTVAGGGVSTGTDQVRFFTKTGQKPWIKAAYDAIVAEYFKPRAGASTLLTIDGVQRLPIVGQDWAENLQLAPASLDELSMPERAISEALVGLDLESERALLEAEGYREFTQHLSGVDPQKDDRPRFISYSKVWKQPQNVIDPASGAPRSTFFFEPSYSNQKPFKAKEHSLVLTLCAFRPHMLRAFEGSYVGRMDNILEWLPPRGEAAWSEIDAGDPLFPAALGLSEGMVFDRSDVFRRGETLINSLPVESPYPPPRSGGDMGLGSIDRLRAFYATDGEINALFVGTNATDRVVHYLGVHNLRVDGVVSEIARARS